MIIETTPATMEGMIMSPESAEPSSLRILIMVTGTSWTIDIVVMTNMHIALLA